MASMTLLCIFASCVMLAQSMGDIQHQSTSDTWSDEDADMGSTAVEDMGSTADEDMGSTAVEGMGSTADEDMGSKKRHGWNTRHAHHASGHRTVGTVAVETESAPARTLKSTEVLEVPEATPAPEDLTPLEEAVIKLHNDSSKILAATAKAEALMRESLQTVAFLEKARSDHEAAMAAFLAANGSHTQATQEADEIAGQLLKAKSTVAEATNLDSKAAVDNDQSYRTMAEAYASLHMHTTMYIDAKTAFQAGKKKLHEMNVTAQAAEAEAKKAEKETGEIAMKVQHLTGGTPCPEAAK